MPRTCSTFREEKYVDLRFAFILNASWPSLTIAADSWRKSFDREGLAAYEAAPSCLCPGIMAASLILISLVVIAYV